MLRTTSRLHLQWVTLGLSFSLSTLCPAQSSIDVVATATIPFHFPIAIGTTDIPIRIDQCQSVGLSMPSPRGDLSLLMVDPSGTVYNPMDSAQATVQMIVSPDPLVNPSETLYVYNLYFDKPLKGDWKLRIGIPIAGTTSTDSCVQMYFHNAVAAVLVTPKAVYVPGEIIAPALVVLDGATKLTALQSTVTLVKIGDSSFQPQPVTMMDDGSGIDAVAGDGTFTGQLQIQNPGAYYLFSDVQGTASTGAFRRTAGAYFRVLPPPANFSGLVDQKIKISYPADK
jgi:hypothetical protein